MPRKNKKRDSPEPFKIQEKIFTVVAADLSLRRPGIAVFNVVIENDVTHIFCDTYSLDNKKSKECRGSILCDIASWLTKIIEDVNSCTKTYFVREKAFNSRASQSEIGIFEVVGITDMLIYKRFKEQWHEIYPITVKKIMTGNAKADKLQVQQSVKEFLNNDFANDDESDAAAVGLAFLMQNEINKMPTERDAFDDT